MVIFPIHSPNGINAHKTRLNDLRAGYLAERRSMLTSQQIDQERLKADWRERSKDRAQAYEELARRIKAAERLKNDYGGAAGPEASRRAVIMGRYERALEFRKAATTPKRNSQSTVHALADN